jgi:hypothetical protein
VKTPRDSLTLEEADRVLKICREHGSMQGTILLGLRTEKTVLAAIALEPVHRLTVRTIRDSLARLP